MRTGRKAAAAAVAAVLLGGVLLPGAAAAQDFSAGGPLWYVDAMKLQPIHDDGVTGEGVTVAVFDGALDPEVAALQDADIEVRQIEGCPDPVAPAGSDFEVLNHGTSVTSLIVGNGTSDSGSGPVGIAPDVRILYYGILQDECENVFPAALDDAVAQGADIVTMSGGSNFLDDELSQEAIDSVAAALRDGVLVVSALPNRDTPWKLVTNSINGVVNVASVDAQAQPATERDGSPMANDDVDVAAPGVDVAGIGFDGTWGMSTWSGNSAATPIVAGVLALMTQRWPDATASQLLQSLIRNTGPEEHELGWSATHGHGIVNATRVLQEDPAQYPDENPLFKEDQPPSFDEVFSAPDPMPSGDAEAGAQDGPGAVPWVIGAGVIILVGVVVTVIVISRRKSGGSADV